MNVIIFNSLLLPPSQTFIRDPAEKLQKFTAYYAGSRRVKGLELPQARTIVINQKNSFPEKLSEQFFKISGFAPNLYQQIKQLNPALIHAQFGLSGALVLPWMDSLKIPLIVHYRGADATVKEEYARYSSLNHWIYFRRLEALKKRTQLFLTVSKFIKQKLLEQGFPADKIRHHYHGVDVEHFYPDSNITRKPIILFVGRLEEKKGCEYLIQAVAKIQSSFPEVKLVFIGDGSLRSKLETFANENLNHFEFLGFQPPEIVKAWMNRAQILAAPSITAVEGDSEGLPNVVLEAQSMALPVLSTLHAGIPEAVIHSETGFLAPERDIDALAEYGLKLLTQPELWKSCSLKGRELMKQKFNRNHQTRALEKIYQEIIELN